MHAFLLRLLGVHPEQLRERERFNGNLKKQDEVSKELDELLVDIRRIDSAIRHKQIVAENTSLVLTAVDDEQGQPEGGCRDWTRGERGCAKDYI